MATKERYQNPAVGDTVNLRMFMYNSNNLADLNAIEKVDIYYLDPNNITDENPDGRRFVETFDGTVVTTSDTGTYMLAILAEDKKYVIGTYIDVWTVTVDTEQAAHHIQNKFQIYPALWYSTPIPIVYDFSFRFLPNKFRIGSKQFLIIEITPNVPTAGELRQYYENLAIVSEMRISIEQNCGDCMPKEKDLRLKVDKELVDYREKKYGYFKIDTEELDMDCGIYDVWFQLDFGDNRYISDRMHIQIYD